MELRLKTWNSLNINDGTIFRAWIPAGQLVNLSADGITVPRALDFPFLSTSVLPSHVLVIEVDVAPGQTINVKRELLKSYFNIMDTVKHNLVAEDLSDSNREWYVTGIPIRVVELDVNAFAITLQLEAPIWKVVTALSDSWSITASAQTRAITNIGNINVKSKFDITPTAAKASGLAYRRWVPIYNKMDVSYVVPFDITGGGFDTAALTTAKMQADGDDLLVMVDGVFVGRWLYDMDTANTKVWINLTLSPRKEGTTSVTISAVDTPTTITFAKTRANLAFLTAMARVANKVLLMGSEAFTFTGVNLVTYQLTGVTRARKGTSNGTHTAPKTIRWIEHDVWMLYGDSTLTAPDVDNDLKPMFALSSTNSFWSYTELYDNTAKRPGAWKPEVNATKTVLSHIFTDTQGAFVNPADEMGLAMVGTQSEYTILSEVAQLGWLFSHPAGVIYVAYSGKKYYSGVSWPEIVGLQYLQEDAARWFTHKNEAIPLEALVWEAFGPYTETLSGSYKSIRFAVDGTIRPALGEKAMAQFDAVGVELTDANIPITSIGAEAAVNFIDLTLTNNTTGEYLKVAMHVKVNDTLTIDCENKKAYTNDGSRTLVTLSTEREAWLDLRSGSNTLQYDDTGTGNVTFVTTHRDRTL